MYFHCIGQMYSKRSRKGTRHAEGKILNYFLFLQHFFPRNTAKYSYITYEYTVLYFSTICTTIAMQCDVVVAGTAVCNAYHMRISMSLWKLGVSTGGQAVGLLICTLISENQGLEKSRSASNLRKISGPANMDFFRKKARLILYVNLKNIQVTN